VLVIMIVTMIMIVAVIVVVRHRVLPSIGFTTSGTVGQPDGSFTAVGKTRQSRRRPVLCQPR